MLTMVLVRKKLFKNSRLDARQARLKLKINRLVLLHFIKKSSQPSN